MDGIRLQKIPRIWHTPNWCMICFRVETSLEIYLGVFKILDPAKSMSGILKMTTFQQIWAIFYQISKSVRSSADHWRRSPTKLPCRLPSQGSLLVPSRVQAGEFQQNGDRCWLSIPESRSQLHFPVGPLHSAIHYFLNGFFWLTEISFV